jgi:hypothetical protein
MPENNTPNTPQGQGQENTVDNKVPAAGEPDKKEPSDVAKLRSAHEKLQADYQQMIATQEAEKKKVLEEQGKHKELYENEKKAREELEAKIQLKDRTVALEKALSKAGVNSEVLDFVTTSLIGQVEVDKKGVITNLDALVTELKTSRPSLFAPEKAAPAGKIGAGVTTNGSLPGTLSASQIEAIISSGDAKLIAEHEEAIRKSLKS